MIVNIINFITDHYNDFFAIIGGIVSVASLIVKLTPTEVDNRIFNSIINFISKISVFNTKIDQQIINEVKKPVDK